MTQFRVMLDAFLEKMRPQTRPSIQERLVALKEKGLSQVDLSDLLGVTEAAVSRWISGDRVPRGKQTHRLLDFIEDSLNLKE